MKIQELYKTVTNRIVAELEAGAIPWLKPWRSGRRNGVGLMPTNYATGHSYRGINIPILWDAAARKGYATQAWLTFRQAKTLKASVRKGERGTTVVFTKKLLVDDRESGEQKAISMLKTFTTFNVDQVEGLPPPPEPLPEPADAGQSAARAFLEASGASISHGGDIACYVPSRDLINLPPFDAFRGAEHYYATALHELTHWSGAKHRLDRDLSGRFGSAAYAAEELIAELGAAFLCAQHGITGDLRHSGYLKTWLELLKSDDRAIFTAASKASQAADFLNTLADDAPEEALEASQR
ncbi:MAG: zincin-like metallopeptidase domain-containing protein [Gammaproteobacteria bacterium]